MTRKHIKPKKQLYNKNLDDTCLDRTKNVEKLNAASEDSNTIANDSNIEAELHTSKKPK